MSESPEYLSGFGNENASEAIPGALPVGQNSPQKPPFGLYAEQLSGTPFTVPRRDARRTWMYRIRPSASHPPYRPIEQPLLCGAAAEPTPNRLRWDPLRCAGKPRDFVYGIVTMPGNAETANGTGVTVHQYIATRDMRRVFWNADGELPIVPRLGRLTIDTDTMLSGTA